MHKVRLYSPAGVLLGESSQYIDLAYTKKVNEPGIGQVRFRANHPFVELFERDCTMKFYRRMSPWILNLVGQPRWTEEFTGIFRKPKWESTSGGDYFVATGAGLLSKLGRRHILYYANTNGLTQFTNWRAESIMKVLVNYNCGPAATVANGRMRSGAMAGVGVEVDRAGGNLVNWYCAWDNLQDSLLRLASIAGGDYALVETGVNQWEFRFYQGQLGTDRHESVRFGSQWRNLEYPVYEYDESDEKTVAMVGGKGEGSSRTMSAPVLSPYYTADNDIETFITGTQEETVAALNTLGSVKLAEMGPKEKIGFEIRQTRSCTYGIHYFLGDLVTVLVRNTARIAKLAGITVADQKEGRETIGALLNIL